MAWKKWRGTPAKGAWHAYWKEHDGEKKRCRSQKLSRDEVVADRLLAEIQANIDRQGVGVGAVMPIGALRPRYIRHLQANNAAPTYVARVSIVLRHLERILNPKFRLPALTADRVDQYKEQRLGEGVDANTVRREIGIIKTAVKKGRRWRWQTPDLTDVEKPLATEPVHLPYKRSEIETFLAAAPPLIGIVLRLGLYTGMRRMEILALRWVDVDFEERTILLGRGWRTKSRRSRAIPMTRPLEAALRAWRETPEADGAERVVPWPATPQALTGRIVYYLRRKCAVPEGAIHTLRRTFLTELKRKDVDTGKMMRAAGQKTERVTQDYVKLSVEDLRDSLDKLDFEQAKTGDTFVGGNSQSE